MTLDRKDAVTVITCTGCQQRNRVDLVRTLLRPGVKCGRCKKPLNEEVSEAPETALAAAAVWASRS